MANKSESWPPSGWLVLEPEPSIMKFGMLDDAPMSDRAHLDRVIALLAEHTDWRPDDEELQESIDDAIESERKLKCQSNPQR